MKTITLAVKGLNFAGCAPEIEKRLSAIAGISAVQASYVSQTATVTYDETRLAEKTVRELLKGCGFACGESPTPASAMDTKYKTSDQSTERATPAQEAVSPTMTMPVTTSPGGSDHLAHHTPKSLAHPAPAHSPSQMSTHGSQASESMGTMDGMMMDHDMSDPAMAKAMEADMRNRFFVSLVLTIPVILYSMLGSGYSAYICQPLLVSTPTGCCCYCPARSSGGAAGCFIVGPGERYVTALSI